MRTLADFESASSSRRANSRFAAAAINFRTRLTRCPWGDQAQFIRRETFLETGGFKEMPLMEDYELAIRMKRRGRYDDSADDRHHLGAPLPAQRPRPHRRAQLADGDPYRMGADIDELARSYRR